MNQEFDNPVYRIFGEHVDVVYQALDELAPRIEQAAQLMLAALQGERRLLVCGIGESAALCQCFSTIMLNGLEQERPSLPVIDLTDGAAALGAITAHYSFAEVFSRQLHALGQPGDLLLILGSSGTSGSLVQAIRAAHERDMVVVALTAGTGGNMASLLYPEDVELRVPVASGPRVGECHLLILHSLAELVEAGLFGGS
jgi:D-sedoheptulose 7-phosphate isomerase